MKFIISALLALSLKGLANAQSYGNNYGFDPGIQQRTHDMLDRQLQMQAQQRMHQEQMLQQQMQQQSMDQMRYQQQWNNMKNDRSCYGYGC